LNRYSLRKLMALIFLVSLLMLIPRSAAQENLVFGVDVGSKWALHFESSYKTTWLNETGGYEISVENSLSNESIVFLNFTENILYLNVTKFEVFYVEEEYTENFTSTNVLVYNLTDLKSFLNKTLSGDYPTLPYILPINWTEVETYLSEINGTANAIVRYSVIPMDEVRGKTVDVFSIKVEINDSDSYVFGNTNYTMLWKETLEGKYGTRTGVLLEGIYSSIEYYYENTTLIEAYNSTTVFWILNSSFTYWEAEVQEGPTMTTIAASVSGAASGAFSATFALLSSTIGTSSLGGAVATTGLGGSVSGAATGTQPSTEFPSFKDKLSWKYLKYLWKLRKLKRKKEKKEIPKNSTSFTVTLALIGAITGVGSAILSYGLPTYTNVLLTLSVAAAGFALAEAGLSLFLRRYYFFRRFSVQLNRREWVSLGLILASAIYGILSTLLSAATLVNFPSLTIFLTVPTAIVGYVTAEEILQL